MPWMFLSEAARHLKLSTRTLRRMIEAKTLNSRMENGRRLVLIENKSGHGDKDSSGRTEGAVSVQRRGPYGARLLRPLFAAYEALGELSSEYASVLGVSSWIARSHHSEDEEDRKKRELYEQLFRGVHECHKNIKSIVFDMRTPLPNQRPLLEQVYLTMVKVRISWEQFSVRYKIDIKENRERMLIERIVEDIKRVLIRSTSRPHL